MGPRETVIDAAPETVWAALSDAYCYDDWVVGTRQIRKADASWPAVGARLYHTVGWPPLGVKDMSEVLESDPPRHLVMRAHVRPLGVFLVDIELHPEGAGTRVVLQEMVVGGIAKLTGKLGDAGAQGRMELGLRQLKALVEAGRFRSS